MSLPIKLIQPNDKVFFLHIPKTAGTTFRFILDNHFKAEQITPLDMYHPKDYANVDIEPYQLIRGHLPINVSQIMPEQILILSFVRQPVDRALSIYRHHRRTKSSGLNMRAHQMDIKTFISSFGEINFINNAMTWYYASDFSFEEFAQRNPQHDSDQNDSWQYNLPDDRVHCAEKNMHQFTFLGVVEKFTESLQLLSFTFGWYPQIEYTTYNIAPEHKYTLLDEEVRFIKQVNHHDMSLYDKAQQLFNERYLEMVEFLETHYASHVSTHHNRIFQLLMAHYSMCYVKRYPNLTDHFHLSMNQPIDGIGWHHPEYNETLGWKRWTGNGTRSIVDLPLAKNRDLQLQMRILSVLDVAIVNSLQITVNGTHLDYKLIRDTPNTWLVKVDIPENILNWPQPYTRFTFDINRTICPDELNPAANDERHLGLLINWLKIIPRP